MRSGQRLLLLTLLLAVGCASNDRTPLPANSHRVAPSSAAGKFWAQVVSGRPDFGYRDQQAEGRRVPFGAISERTNHGSVRYGLANCGALLGSAYPVRSTDGRTWRIAGPELYRAAAQGPESVSYITARRRLVALWGASVVSSSDGGRHWWRTYLADGVRSVRIYGDALVALAQGEPVRNSPLPRTAMYESTDGGRTWRWVRSVRPTPPGPMGAHGVSAPTCG